MKPLWRGRPELSLIIAAQQRLILFLDFDGTLSPMAATPVAARFPDHMRRVLLRLVSLPDVHVAVMSGRTVAYLRMDRQNKLHPDLEICLSNY